VGAAHRGGGSRSTGHAALEHRVITAMRAFSAAAARRLRYRYFTMHRRLGGSEARHRPIEERRRQRRRGDGKRRTRRTQTARKCPRASRRRLAWRSRTGPAGPTAGTRHRRTAARDGQERQPGHTSASIRRRQPVIERRVAGPPPRVEEAYIACSIRAPRRTDRRDGRPREWQRGRRLNTRVRSHLPEQAQRERVQSERFGTKARKAEG
jgi:hypothetical protein